MLLTRPPEEIVERLLPGDGAVFGAIAHSFRETIKDEFDAVMERRLDDERVCLEQLDHYRLDYADVLAMRPIAGGVLARRHNHPEVIAAMERWWYHVLRYSRRDQLSLLAALSHTQVTPVVANWDLRDNLFFRWPASIGRNRS